MCFRTTMRDDTKPGGRICLSAHRKSLSINTLMDACRMQDSILLPCNRLDLRGGMRSLGGRCLVSLITVQFRIAQPTCRVLIISNR